MPETADDKLRIDKWLWAARFYKTRSLASDAVESGKVSVNGARVKPARPLKVGDELRIETRGADYVVHVLALSARRGSATEAARLYRETEASRQQRRDAQLSRTQAHPDARIRGRPTKRARRQMHKLRGEPL